jgi:hypothetical protein
LITGQEYGASQFIQQYRVWSNEVNNRASFDLLNAANKVALENVLDQHSSQEGSEIEEEDDCLAFSELIDV